MNFGVDDLGGKLLGQVRDAGGNRTAHMPLRAGPAGPDAKHGWRGRCLAQAAQNECVLSVGDQCFAPAAAERSAAAQEKGGFEQAGLARGIRSDEKIDPGIELQLDTR